MRIRKNRGILGALAQRAARNATISTYETIWGEKPKPRRRG